MWAPRVCPFQRATLASPWAMSSISTSSGDGSSRSSLRPESMRCHARGASPLSALALRACGSFMAMAELGALRMPMARHEMIVDHAGRLHERVDDGRSHELEAAPHELGGDLFGH